MGQVVVDPAEAPRLVRFADEGPHHPDARDLLTKHLVHPVEALLHHAELRDQSTDEQAQADGEDGRAGAKQPGHPCVLPECHDHAADDGHRGREHHGAAHHHQELHLLHVVGEPGDERWCGELVDLPGREPDGPGEQCLADITSEPHRYPGTEEDGCDGEPGLDQCDCQHLSAESPDQVGVAFEDTVIDHPGVEVRQIQVQDRLDGLQDDEDNQQAAVGTQVLAEEDDQHRSPLQATPSRNMATTSRAGTGR